MFALVVATLVLGLLLSLAFGLSRTRRARALESRYAKIIDVDAYLERARRELERDSQLARERAAEELQRVERNVEAARERAEAVTSEARRRAAEAQTRMDQLSKEYEAAKALMDRLRHEISLLEETSEDISFGVYKPHYSFQTSKEYKSKLDAINERQKELIRDGEATKCAAQWTVDGSKTEGARMQKQYTKLMLRAFNGESDAAVAKVAWNNITRMEERIRKAFDEINTLGVTMHIAITIKYRDLRLAELRLEHELAEKRQEEAEEQRRIREQMREEEKAEREIEKAKMDAEKEESRYAAALEKARREAAEATGSQMLKLNDKISELEARVQEAQQNRERAQSRAQMTRSGHVYVISNIGSFGDKVFKIGMTRRLDPLDRVRELGDASVPFAFDVHGILFHEDAPGLENELHRYFADRRVNLVNGRKEFFHIDIEDIEAFARARNLKLELTKIAEAKEYRETQAQRSQAKASPAKQAEIFPDKLPSTPPIAA